MPRTSYMMNNFNAGEISPLLEGRVDISKYYNAAKTIENFLVTPYGGIEETPGTKFVSEVKTNSKSTRLFKFEFSVEQAYIIEFGDQYVRFYKDQGRIENPPGTPIEIATPYLEAELFDLQFAQSFDTLYITHNNHAVRKLTRTSHIAWALTVVDFQNGPYLFEIGGSTGGFTLIPSADTGNGINVNAPSARFLAGHVGSSWRIKDGWVKVTAFINVNNVTANVQLNADGSPGDLNTGPGATTDWQEGAWSDVRGYPACVTFFEGRLCFANSPNNPQTFWASKSQDFERMDSGAADDDALVFTIASEQVDIIRWLSSGDVLSLGTTGGVYSAKGTSNAPMTPTNIDIKRDTTYGSAFTLPKKIGNFIYYLQKNLKNLRELSFNFDIDGRNANDMTLLAEQITGVNGIVEMDYQQSPHNVLWCVRADGQISTLTRQIQQEVIGWSRQITDGLFESVAVIPQDTYDEVWVVVNRTIGGSTKRYVEYFTAPRNKITEQEDYFYVHSGLSLDVPITISGATQANPVVITATAHGLSNGDQVVIRGIVGMTELNKGKFKIKNKTANTFELTDSNDDNIDGTGFTAYVSGGEARKAVTTVSGLNHLEGKTVDILVDGATHPQKVVSSGSITLDDAYGEIHVGLPYLPKLQTLRPELQTAEGTAQGKIKRVINITMRIHESLGFKVGTDLKQDDALFDREYFDQAQALFTGDKKLQFPAGYNKEGNILITQPYPLPLNILAIILQINVENG